MHSETIVYRGRYLQVSERLIGSDVYELAHLRAAVIIYARNDQGKLLFVREHRPHENPPLRLKPVTGFIDNDDDWRETAERELREEAGLVATSFKLIRHIPVKGSLNTDKYFVLAEGLQADPDPLTNPDGDVIEEIVYLTLEQAIEMTLKNELPITVDSLGLFLLKEMKL